MQGKSFDKLMQYFAAAAASLLGIFLPMVVEILMSDGLSVTALASWMAFSIACKSLFPSSTVDVCHP